MDGTQIELNIENIPVELKAIPQWVVHKPDKGKPKVPHNYITGKPTDCTNPQNWASFEVATRAYNNGNKYDGIAFVFDPEGRECGIDLDHCRDPETGIIEPGAARIISLIDSYTEISQSGKGVHIYCRGSKPGSRCKTEYQGHEVEIYTEGRCLIVTGHRVPDTPESIMDRDEQIAELYTEVFGPDKEPSPQPSTPATPTNLDDQELIKKALAAKNGGKFENFWAGNDIGYSSQSEADLAFCNELAFWTGKNAEQMDRLFRQSGLMRPKWDRSAGHDQTYGQRTIRRAIEKCEDIYTPYQEKPKPSRPDNSPGQKIDTTSFNLTDSGSAELFAAMYADKVRYNYARGQWLIWNDKIWKPDSSGSIQRLALKMVRKKYEDVAPGRAKHISDDRRKAISSHAFGSESRAKRDAFLDVAQSVEPLADSGEGWDADPNLLAVQNGVLDLKTSELLPAEPSQKITKMVDIPYIPDAPAPRWLRFLPEIFNNDTDLIKYIHLAIGLSLTGHTVEQILFILFGPGANGKSRFLAVLRLICGDFAFNAPFSTFELYQRQGIPQDLAILEGHRLITASETTENARLNEGRLKALTGEDVMTARFLYGREFSFVPQGKIWMAVNHKPRVKDDSFGFWRRVRPIPFTQRFDPQTEPDLGETLKNEAPGILAWAVQGAKKWYETGMGPTPDAILKAMKAYQEQEDPIAEWLNENCVQNEDFQVSAQAVFEDYQDWAEKVRLSKKETLSRQMFGRILTDRFDKKRLTAGYVYYGLKLRNLTNS